MKKILNILKENMVDYLFISVFAFLMGIVVGGCVTFNYIITDHNETLHELLDEIRTYKGK